MIRDYAPFFFKVALTVVPLSFIIAKLLIMVLAKVKHNYLSVFVNSMMIYSHQQIRNTFDGRMKKYLRLSNRVNTVFYASLGAIGLSYVVVWMIS